MSHRPYPRKSRVRKYAMLHGKRATIRTALYVMTGEFPLEERERMRRALDELPPGKIEFTAWFSKAAS